MKLSNPISSLAVLLPIALVWSSAPAPAQSLINGGVVSGAISPAGDQDTYTFSASAGEGFQIQLADVNTTTLSPLMELFDPIGTLLEVRWNTAVASITRTATTTGTYSIVVRDGTGSGMQTGAYDVYFTLAPGANEGGALVNGSGLHGTIDVGDLDSYTFSALAGEGFQLQAADTDTTTLNPMMRLYDPSGALLETRWNTDVASITRTAASAGTYTLVVSDGNTQPSQTGGYDLHFTRAPGANEGGALPNGGSVVDVVDLGDLDSYTFTASAGEGFQLQVGDTNTTTLTPMMRLYDPSGTLLETRWNTDVASITRTASTAGTYTLVVSDGNTQPSQTGAYALHFTRAPGANEGGALINGGSIADIVDLGDLDSYTFAASAGEGFQLQVADTNTTGLTPLMRLYDPSGALLESRWNTSVASITRTAASAGTYTLVVSDGNTQPSQTGAYVLHYTRAPGANEGGALINGGSIAGTVDLGDLDSYTFAASAGQGFQLQLADVNGTSLTPLMRLYDPSGTLLESRWATSVASIVRTPTATGTYTLVVSDGNNQPSGVGDYDLYFTLRPGANEGGTLPNGGVVSGTVGLGDLDSYTFDASAGEGFQIQMADVGATALIPLMRLYDPSGTLLETRSNANVASIVHTASSTGTYTLVCSDGNAQPSQTGAYDLYFALAPGANEGGTLPNGGSVADTVDLGDLDSYTFSASVGEGLQLRMADVNGTALHPLIRLYDPSGTLVESRSNANVASIVRTAASTGTYTVVVSDGNTTPSQTGNYELHFTRAPGANEHGALVNGVSFFETVDLGDLDSYTFPSLAGEPYQIVMTDLNLTALDPQIRVYDPSGAFLQAATGLVSATISRTAASTGTYTIVVGDGSTSPTGTGDYEIFVNHGLETYCVAGTTANGCTATMSGSGNPSLGDAIGFVVHASSAEGEKDGLFFFGTNGRQANPWGNGTSFQCVVPPVKRSPLINSGGTSGSCDGDFVLDFNALITAQPTKAPPAGSEVQIQCWFRDPQNTSNQSTSLSDALEFWLHP